MKNKNLYPFLFLIFLVTTSQFILANKHLEFGFFTDDWLFLSIYRAYVVNPLFDIFSAWKNVGAHNFAHTYYMGILFNFFGMNYLYYHLLNQIFKIIATLTLYPLIIVISKNKWLAFLSTLFFAIHYSPFGTLDNVSRGEDFIAIASMNLFLMTYFYIIKRGISKVLVIVGLAGWLFGTILIDSTRLFPIIFLMPLIELFNIILNRTRKQTAVSLKRLAVLFFPFLPLFIFSPNAILFEVRYSIGLIDKMKTNNWQLFLTPFAAMGSTYIPKNLWFLFGHPVYETFGNYITFLLRGPVLIFFLLNLFLSFFISKKPLRFVRLSLFLDLVFGIIVFLPVHNWLFLDQAKRAPVDPGNFLVPSLIGIFILIEAFSLFLEWKKGKEKDSLISFLFLGPVFTLFFTFLTWVFADLNSIFMNVHPYLNIPSIGTSVTLGALILLIYRKLKTFRILAKNQIVAVLFIILLMTAYFKISALNVDEYFSHWLNNGLRAQDQDRLINQFWKEIGTRTFDVNNPPVIFLDATKDYDNGTFYAEAMVWKVSSWLDLKYNKPKGGRFTRCDIVILNKAVLESGVANQTGEKLLVPAGPLNCRGEDVSYNSKDILAFKLINRNLIPDREEILQSLRLQ